MDHKELRKEIENLKSREKETQDLRRGKEAQLEKIIRARTESSTKSYSKLFAATHAISFEPCTVLVEAVSTIDGFTWFDVKAIEGEYNTREEFEDARYHVFLNSGSTPGYQRAKRGEVEQREVLFSDIYLNLPGFIQLRETFNVAIKAMERAGLTEDISYTKIFTAKNAIRDEEPFTIRVHASHQGEWFTDEFSNPEYTLLQIDSVEGEYDTPKDFDKAYSYVIDGLELSYQKAKRDKVEQEVLDHIYLSDDICLNLLDSHLLAETFNEAIKAMEHTHSG